MKIFKQYLGNSPQSIMAIISIPIGTQNIDVTAVPLTQAAFSSFGDVVANPKPNIHPSTFSQHASSLLPNASSANQGTAIKYSNVSRIRNLYDQAPSRRSEPAMSIFSCATRQLAGAKLNTPIMERHPFTTQTFTPIASKATKYLVIVAPSLPSSSHDDGLPVPHGASEHPGRGLPDVSGLKAFVATSAQAVTYGAGTWHCPMVALGEPGQTLDFVVTQFVSGVDEEDCQLIQFVSTGNKEPRVNVKLLEKSWRSKL